MDLNLASDFGTLDGLVAVTYFRRTAEDGFAVGIGVPKALKRAVTHYDQSGVVLVSQRETVWHIPDSAVAGTPSKTGDVVQEADGTRWVVERAEQQTIATRWRLICRREV